MPTIVFSHESPEYRKRWKQLGAGRFNGAYYYSQEIVENIIPRVNTNRPWVTINVTGCCEDRAIVFIHNNLHPLVYNWLANYKDLVLVCGIPETVAKMGRLGRAVYLPLSVDVPYVEQFRRDKDRDVAFIGRPKKRKGKRFPRGTEFVEGLRREEFLEEVARYRQVYAVGRAAIEARVLGCEILPYDERFPDPAFWKVLDNAEAAGLLQRILDES